MKHLIIYDQMMLLNVLDKIIIDFPLSSYRAELEIFMSHGRDSILSLRKHGYSFFLNLLIAKLWDVEKATNNKNGTTWFLNGHAMR